MNDRILHYLRKLLLVARDQADGWRARAFEGAIEVIRGWPTEITTVEDLKGVGGIGKGIRDRIAIILTTGGLPEIDEVERETVDRLETLELFQTVHGIGPVKARALYDRGYRTLDQLRASNELTAAQKAGIAHVDELDTSIPRDEITAIFNKLCDVTRAYNETFHTDLTMVVAGSYRRGKPKSGDIDIVIVNRDPTVKASIHVPQLVAYFQLYHLFTEILGMGVVKCLAICQLDSEHPHRRIDLEIVDEPEHYFSAILYFTGSKTLNVHMREEARKKGWVLNQNGLYDEKGNRFSIMSEEGYFEALGMKPLTPAEREW